MWKLVKSKYRLLLLKSSCNRWFEALLDEVKEMVEKQASFLIVFEKCNGSVATFICIILTRPDKCCQSNTFNYCNVSSFRAFLDQRVWIIPLTAK